MLADLAQEMVKDGWDVNVITTGAKAGDEFQDGVFVKRLRASTKQKAINYITIWLKLFFAAMKFRKTDLIVTMTDPPMLILAGRIISKRRRIPHIHWCQDMYPDLFPFVGVPLPFFLMKNLRKLSLLALRTCSKVIVIGDCMAARWKKLEFDHRRLSVITNWPDREFQYHDVVQFHAEPKLTENSEKPLIVDRSPKFRVLYAGNIGRAHPIKTILEAASILQMSNPEVEFLFVGEGPGYDRLVVERTRLGLENIRLLPTQPKFKLREMMQSGDLHLVSIKQEVAGLLVPSKIYAAFASHRPSILVGPQESEAGEVLQKYRAGTVIAQGNPKALAEAILQYRMDGSKWFETHKGARAASEYYTAERSIKDWIACARSIIRSP